MLPFYNFLLAGYRNIDGNHMTPFLSNEVASLSPTNFRQSSSVPPQEFVYLCAKTQRTMDNLSSMMKTKCVLFCSDATLHYMSSRQYCFIDRVPYEIV